jgi:hypothetical protein
VGTIIQTKNEQKLLALTSLSREISDPTCFAPDVDHADCGFPHKESKKGFAVKHH